MKKLFLCLSILVSSLISRAQFNEWTWVNGETSSILAVMGTQGVFDSLNHPEPLYESNGWRDNQGHFWYLTTSGYLWEYDPTIEQWRFVWYGPSIQPVHGVKGVPAVTNEPGHRSFGMVTWTDASGDLWFFSGYCSGITYADMWRYNIASNMWTWVSGSSVANDLGVYGTMGVPSVNNYPMGRCETNVSWLDSTNNIFWMFGGDRAITYTSIGDLWKYDPSTNEWTWMNGDTSATAPPVYGTFRVADPANFPGARLVYCKWSDLSGNMFLFGGSADVFSYKNDTWKYDPLTNQWTWMNGSQLTGQPGVAGAQCTFDVANTPPAEFENKTCWTDHCGNVWVFGRAYNSVWTYRSLTGEWSLIRGNANSDLTINYGVKGVSDPANNPAICNGAVGWISLDGSMYFLNNSTNSVMWKYVPDPACTGCAIVPTALFTAPNHICPGTCTDFTNLSQYATSYVWTFAGANPSTSTDANPTNICYNTPGNYSVQLIATSSTGSDTLTLNNYITVYNYPPPQGITQSGDTLFANAGAVSYQWYQDGNLIAGATDYFYVATQSGNYNVVATDANGCEVEAVIFDVIASVVAYGNAENDLRIYPNPSDKSILVSHPDLKSREVNFEILTVVGQRVDAQTVSNDESDPSLDISRLAAGIYWLQVKIDSAVLRAKFVKQ